MHLSGEFGIIGAKAPLVATGGAFFMKIKDGFEDFLDYSRKRGLKEQTLKDYKKHLFGSLSHCPIKDKKVRNLKLTDAALVMEGAKNHGQFGIQKAIIVYRQYLKFLKESGVRIFFDYRDIEVPKIPHKIQPVLHKKELSTLFKNISLDTITSLRLRVLLEVLFATGGRIGEVLQLNIDSIDWEKKEARIINSKTKDEEIIYFTDRSLCWLKRYLKKREDNCLALFVNKNGTARLKQVTSRAALYEFQKKHPQLECLNHHLFRRTLATHLIESGADIKSTQTIMRHKSSRTTLKFYVVADKKRAKKIHQKLANFK